MSDEEAILWAVELDLASLFEVESELDCDGWSVRRVLGRRAESKERLLMLLICILLLPRLPAKRLEWIEPSGKVRPK